MSNRDASRRRAQKHQNATAFTANRSRKRDTGVVAKENALKEAAQEGVCERCRQKVLWRFKYGKYKQLGKANGKCSGCRQPNMHLNYRTLCGECAKARGVCPGCAKPEGSQVAGASVDDDDVVEEEEQSGGDAGAGPGQAGRDAEAVEEGQAVGAMLDELAEDSDGSDGN